MSKALSEPYYINYYLYKCTQMNHSLYFSPLELSKFYYLMKDKSSLIAIIVSNIH